MSDRADISAFPDANEIAVWATDAVSWANHNKIINGSKEGDQLYIRPAGLATRAEVAQMMKNFQERFR